VQISGTTPQRELFSAVWITEDVTMGAILLWLLGVPIPIIIILLLLWH
jgi:hypothetical protein